MRSQNDCAAAAAAVRLIDIIDVDFTARHFTLSPYTHELMTDQSIGIFRCSIYVLSRACVSVSQYDVIDYLAVSCFCADRWRLRAPQNDISSSAKRDRRGNCFVTCNEIDSRSAKRSLQATRQVTTIDLPSGSHRSSSSESIEGNVKSSPVFVPPRDRFSEKQIMT